MGQEVAHECPFLDRLDCRLCVLLLCRPIGEAVKEGLHERRSDNVNRIGSQRVGPLRKAEQVAVANARGPRERIVLRARQIGPNDFGKAATLNVTLSLPHGSPPLSSAPRRTMPRFDSLPQGGARPLSTAKAACRRSSSVAGTAPAAPNSRSCSRPRRCARRASRDLETEAGRGATRRLLGFVLIGCHLQAPLVPSQSRVTEIGHLVNPLAFVIELRLEVAVRDKLLEHLAKHLVDLIRQQSTPRICLIGHWKSSRLSPSGPSAGLL